MEKREETTRRSLWSEDLAGGLFMMTVAAVLFVMGRDLTFGSLRAVGPGLLPASLSVIVGGLGLLLAILSLRQGGETLSSWSLRGIVFILGAFVVFALTVRPLGLAVAGPLAVTISGFASPETRFVETLVFGVAMTAFCAVLFKLVLNLPIPLLPWLLGY